MDEMNIFYLHPCARTSAEWLNDRDTKSMIAETGRLISATVAMATLEQEEALSFPRSYLRHPFLDWALASTIHAEWLLSYFASLTEKHRRLFGSHLLTWKFEAAAARLIHEVLPQTEWTNPPCEVPEDCKLSTVDASYRRYYTLYHVKFGSYRRVPAPYWAREHLNREETEDPISS